MDKEHIDELVQCNENSRAPIAGGENDKVIAICVPIMMIISVVKILVILPKITQGNYVLANALNPFNPTIIGIIFWICLFTVIVRKTVAYGWKNDIRKYHSAQYQTEDIDKGKAFAIISYVVPLGFIIPLIQRNNTFSLFHAKQVLLLALFHVSVVLLSFIPIVGFIVGLFIIPLFLFWIMGIVLSAKGYFTPIPYIGKYTEQWFRGISVRQ